MKRELNILNNVRVASPCEVPWSSMHGDDRARVCEVCNRDVFNLSALTREEAERLIIEKRGKLCINYYQRRDGTIMTQDCPRGIAKIRKRMLRLAAFASAACVACFTAISTLAAGPRGARHLNLRWYEPFTNVASMADNVEWRIRNWLSPPNRAAWGRLGGDINMPEAAALDTLTAEQIAELDEFVHAWELHDPQTLRNSDLNEKRKFAQLMSAISNLGNAGP